MYYRPKGLCDPCANDWKQKIKVLWERYNEVVTAVQVNGKRYYPNGDGLVMYDQNTEVIDQLTYFTLVCNINNNSVMVTITQEVDDWVIDTPYFYEMNGYYDLPECFNLTISDEGDYYLLLTQIF